MACPDAEVLVAFACGELAGDALETIDELDDHLDRCADCQVAVVELAGGAPVGAGGLARGDQLGRYLILGPVGAGAMGAVYAAHDPELDRKVAIKVLRPGRGGPLARARLVREAKALARLSHPNVVTVYDAGETGDSVYLAMELVEGATLRDWLARQPAWPEVRELFAQVARGLAAAHRADLVHRDVKPENIVVGDDGRARVTDFGLVRGLGDELVDAYDAPGDEPLVTRTGVAVGTPAYMAPEQLRGETADARADQWALGVALHEAVYGGRPFDGDSFGELRQAVVDGERAPTGKRRAPRYVARVIDRALAPRPEDRYPEMGALADELTRARSRTARAGAAAVALLGLAVVGLVYSRGGAPEVEPCGSAPALFAGVWDGDRRAEVETAFAGKLASYGDGAAARVGDAIDRWGERWRQTHRATCRATRVTGEQSDALLEVRMRCLAAELRQLDALVDRLTRADDAAILGAAEAVGALPDAAACARAESLAGAAPPPPGASELLDAIDHGIAAARAELAVGDYAAARDAVAPLVERARGVGYLPVVAEAELVHAEAVLRAGDAAGAEAIAYRALWAADEAGDDRRVARSWLLVVAAAGEREEYERAAHLAEHARAAVARIDAGARIRAALANARGLVALGRGDYDAAEEELTRALALRREAPADGVAIARALTSLGNLERARGSYDRALDYHRRAMAADAEVRGSGHPGRGRHLHNIAGVLRLQGDLAGARAHYRDALAHKIERLGDRHPEVALTHNSLGLVARQLGELDEAAAHHRQAREIFAALGDRRAAIAAHNLALVAAARGDHAGAVELLDEALIGYRGLGERHPRIARALAARARALVGLGKRRDAAPLFERAAAMASELGDGELAARLRAEKSDAERRRARRRRPEPPARVELESPDPGIYAPGRSWDAP